MASVDYHTIYIANDNDIVPNVAAGARTQNVNAAGPGNWITHFCESSQENSLIHLLQG